MHYALHRFESSTTGINTGFRAAILSCLSKKNVSIINQTWKGKIRQVVDNHLARSTRSLSAASGSEEIIWVQTLATLRGHRLLPFPCFGISSIPPWINCQNSPSCIISKLQIQTSQTNLGMEKNTGS